MEGTQLSSYSWSTRWSIRIGLPLFFVLAGGSLWSAFDDPASPAASLILLSMGAGFLTLALFGLRLVPWLDCHVAATDEGLHIFDRQLQESFIPWKEVARTRDWPTLQVLEILGPDGKRVLCVDYWVSNFAAFHATVQRHAGERRP
jgi:hypothetical protein